MPPAEEVVAGRINTESYEWTPYKWDDDKTGMGVRGEAVVLQDYSTSGCLSTGFWRLYSTSPGAEPDGSHDFLFPTPAGDDITWVLEGSATLTVVSTGEKHVVTPGSIFSTPRGLPIRIQTSSPAFKTAWLIWQGSRPAGHPPTGLLVNSIHDSSVRWSTPATDTPGKRTVPTDEFYTMWDSGTAGHLTSCLGRSEDSSESQAIPYVSKEADETIYVMEGNVEIVEEVSGATHKFGKGDTIGLSKGLAVTWASKGRTTIVSIKTNDD